MKILDKYVSESDKDKPESKDKKVISDDSFAVCEFLDGVIDKLERLRISNLMIR